MSQPSPNSGGRQQDEAIANVSVASAVQRQTEEVLARIEETRPLLSDLERLRSGEGTGDAANDFTPAPPMPIITRSIVFSPTTSTASPPPAAELSQPNQRPAATRSTNGERLASIVAGLSNQSTLLTTTTSSDISHSEGIPISRMLTSHAPTRLATTSANTTPVVSRYRYRRSDSTRPGAGGGGSLESSQDLLSSLHDLRSNLVDRVESLGAEIDMLRRRAQDLEREFVERDDPLGNGGGGGLNAEWARPRLLVNPFRGNTEQVTAPIVDPLVNSEECGDSTTTEGTACPPQKRTGSGAAEIEGDRAARRMRRLEGLASASVS